MSQALDSESRTAKKLRRARNVRVLLLAAAVFMVTLCWAIIQWLHIPHRTPVMLFWLVVAPLSASLLLSIILSGVQALLPSRPISVVSSITIPLLHMMITVTIAALLSQQSSPIVNFSEPQNFIRVWTMAKLFIPIAIIELVVIGLISTIDQLIFNRPLTT